MLKKILILFVVLIFCNSANATKQYNERYYQNKWCNQWNGRQEVKLYDNTRVDCITQTYAVEFDFTKKWAECFGQATHYADLTNKKPAYLLLLVYVVVALIICLYLIRCLHSSRVLNNRQHINRGN